MDDTLFKAILAMDSYNRGYNYGIDLNIRNANGDIIQQSDAPDITHIGNATVYKNLGNADAQNIGFYGIAYTLSSGNVVISYRGTDSLFGTSTIGSDWYNGYGVALGHPDGPEGAMAFSFYNAVDLAAADNVSISTTGHSLGGGLVNGERNNSLSGSA